MAAPSGKPVPPANDPPIPTVAWHRLDAAALSNMSATEFLYSTMRSPSAETRWRMEAAKKLVDKETAAPVNPAESAKVIDATICEADRIIIDARLDRLRELGLKNLLLETDLTPAEQVELERLDAWADTLPPHLTGQDADDIELRRLLAEDDSPRRAAAPAHLRRPWRAPQASGGGAPRAVERTAPPLDDKDDVADSARFSQALASIFTRNPKHPERGPGMIPVVGRHL